MYRDSKKRLKPGCTTYCITGGEIPTSVKISCCGRFDGIPRYDTTYVVQASTDRSVLTRDYHGTVVPRRHYQVFPFLPHGGHTTTAQIPSVCEYNQSNCFICELAYLLHLIQYIFPIIVAIDD